MYKFQATDCEWFNNISKHHTKQLLKNRYTGPYAHCHLCEDFEKCRDKVYEELGHREHVPSKQESKALRKQKIKEGK